MSYEDELLGEISEIEDTARRINIILRALNYLAVEKKKQLNAKRQKP